LIGVIDLDKGKKKKPAPENAQARAEAIDAFWKFWSAHKDEVAASVVEGMSQSLVQSIGAHVSAVDASLDWELGPGRKSAHHLCVSGKGDPVMRVICEQWLHRAPPPDATWEYYASRQPHGRDGMVLDIGGESIELDALACKITEDDAYEKLDLDVFHPKFKGIRNKDLKAQIMFIGLDTRLGEDDVERWIGALETIDRKPKHAVPFPELRARIDAFAKKCDGEKWVLLSGEVDGAPIMVGRNNAVKRIDHLLFDTHVEIRIALRAPDHLGMPEEKEHEALEEMDEALTEALGKNGVYIARETHKGSRAIHLHVMEGGPAAAIIDAWRKKYPGDRIDVSVRSDPRWEILERWD